MKNMLAAVKKAGPSLKLIAKGAAFGGIPLFIVATVAFGYFSGVYGLPTPPAEVEDLTSSISQAFNFDD